MTHSSMATDKQIEYLYSLHKKHSLPIPAEVEGGTISKADASALIEFLKNEAAVKPIKAAVVKAKESYQVKLYKMLIEMETEMISARADAVKSISRIDAALDRMAPTIKALHPYMDQQNQDVADYEEFLDDNEPELNYDKPADDEPDNYSTDTCPF